MRRSAAVLCFALLAACSNATDSRRVLELQGYQNVELTGYAFDTCGAATISVTGFKAIAPNGQPVEGIVCENLYGSHAVQIR